MSSTSEYYPYYDFEQLYFDNNSDIDTVINNFFIIHDNIKGDKEYITYEIKNIVKRDLHQLKLFKYTNIGRTTYIKHNVIPDNNNNNSYYTYCINTYIV